MKSVRTTGCHVGLFREFVGTACCTYGQSNRTNGKNLKGLYKEIIFMNNDIKFLNIQWIPSQILNTDLDCAPRLFLDSNCCGFLVHLYTGQLLKSSGKLAELIVNIFPEEYVCIVTRSYSFSLCWWNCSRTEALANFAIRTIDLTGQHDFFTTNFTPVSKKAIRHHCYENTSRWWRCVLTYCHKKAAKSGKPTPLWPCLM